MGLYNDLCREIDILNTRINDLESEYKFWYKACFGTGSRLHIPLDRCLGRMKEICDLVEGYTSLLEEKEKAKKEIEAKMSEFEGLEYQIMYLREVEGKTLAEIAAELGYSLVWIKKVHARMGKSIPRVYPAIK